LENSHAGQVEIWRIFMEDKYRFGEYSCRTSRDFENIHAGQVEIWRIFMQDK